MEQNPLLTSYLRNLVKVLFKCQLLKYVEQLFDKSNNASYNLIFMFDVLTGQIDFPKILSMLEITRSFAFEVIGLIMRHLKQCLPCCPTSCITCLCLCCPVMFFKKKIRNIFFRHLCESAKQFNFLIIGQKVKVFVLVYLFLNSLRYIQI